MTHTFVSALVLLMLILDPLGNIPLFASSLRPMDAARRWRVIVREHAIAFVILLGFLFSGETFLAALGLSSVSLQLAGGVVLFLIAIRMIFPPTGGSQEVLAGEPFIVPLAVPAIAGPSSMATVMLLVSQQPARILEWTGALTVAMLASLVLLLGANRIQHVLGDRFVLAMEKLMGLILVAVGIEMLVRGYRALLATL